MAFSRLRQRFGGTCAGYTNVQTRQWNYNGPSVLGYRSMDPARRAACQLLGVFRTNPFVPIGGPHGTERDSQSLQESWIPRGRERHYREPRRGRHRLRDSQAAHVFAAAVDRCERVRASGRGVDPHASSRADYGFVCGASAPSHRAWRWKRSDRRPPRMRAGQGNHRSLHLLSPISTRALRRVGATGLLFV